MHESNGQMNNEMRTYFIERFGVSSDVVASLQFHARGSEIWASSHKPPLTLSLRRPSGLLSARQEQNGLQPDGSFLVALGDRITASRCELSLTELRSAALGQRVDVPHTDGSYAVCWNGDVFGAGHVQGGQIQLLLSPGHRSELLRSLEADVRPQ